MVEVRNMDTATRALGIALALIFCGAFEVSAQYYNNQSTVNTIGNMDFYSGSDSAGNNWSGTGQSIGNMYFFNGNDSSGNRFSQTCQTIGNMTFCN
jgi:hypothetical protein